MKTIASRISPVLSGYRFHFLLLFCLIGYSSKPSCLYGQEAPKMIIKGTITEAGSGEAIYGATVYHPASKRGTAANEYGFFSLQVDQAQNHQLRFSAMGYRDTLLAASCQARTCEVSIVLTPTSALLETVTVSANSELSSQQFRNGVTTLSALDIQRTPVLLGEKDILKSLQLLPGVSNPREGFGGLFVRGGSPDQNLILLDDAPVYNAFHLFGFLSVFNPDAVRHVALHKGVFPARYGGRLSSVLDLRMKEGNREGFHGSGGIGLIAARVNLEGPIGKSKKFSYLLSGRRSYVDLLLGLLGDESEKNVIAFHDGNAKINFKPDDRNTFFLSSYTGRDRFVFANNFDDQQLEDGFSWGNTTFTLRWAHQLSDQAFLKTTLLRSDFNFEQYTEDIQDGIRFANRVENGIRNLGAKMDLDLALTSEHQLKAGAAVTEHTFISAVAALQEVSLDSFALATPQNTAQEYAVYLEDSWSITPNWRVNLGLRWNGFATEDQFYQNIEPRIFSQWQLGKTTALRAGYLRSNQYLHLLSNSGAGLPTDLWVATDDNIQPQRGWQVTGGWVKDWPKAGLSLSVDAFYKASDRIIGYREGASFLVLDFEGNGERVASPDLSDNITSGDAYAYGSELLLDYQSSRLDARIAYTYLRVRQRLAGVNEDAYFAANQDRRHDLNLSLTYRLSATWQASINWTYGSGVPTTLPAGAYETSFVPGFRNAGSNRFTFYGDRNADRLPSIHRLDIALRWYRNPRWGKAHWEFGLYNAYNRANPFYLRSVPAGQNRSRLVQVSLFPIIPSISYNFSF